MFDVPELNRQLSMESSVIAETVDEVVEFNKLAVEDENKIIQDEAIEVGTVFFKIVLCCLTLILNEKFWFVDL